MTSVQIKINEWVDKIRNDSSFILGQNSFDICDNFCIIIINVGIMSAFKMQCSIDGTLCITSSLESTDQDYINVANDLDASFHLNTYIYMVSSNIHNVRKASSDLLKYDFSLEIIAKEK